ncbi:MAG: phosphoenolpyruvate--protein phosphotransferase [Candidatus Omnitrophota bacterium]|nr:phosphoenolpyruvate--protein phosphotransferase [Candidatus Omnitrophota bacterium]MBU2527869.1 phosphoenolpyruvate--protein phosphotransferase [bacterium]MBU4123653.1 phosphoenolpyruvate--protein phosphotransferase [bacterium]
MVYKGMALSPGIAIGRVYSLKRAAHKVHRRSILPNEVKPEISRFRKAVDDTRKEMISVEDKVKKALSSKKSSIFEGYRLFLEDKMLINETETLIKDQRVNAEFAFSMQLNKIISEFKKIKNDYLKERARDVSELGRRVMSHLMDMDDKVLWGDIPPDSVLVAYNITPSDTAHMKSNNIRAFVTDIGGKTSHTAIVARALEIPAVTGLRDFSVIAEPGQDIIVDGENGIVITDPDEETVINYKRERKRYQDEQHSLQKLMDLPAVSTDGVTFGIEANIEIAEEIATALAYGAEGIGLYRSEYMFINSEALPGEDEQYAQYKTVCEKMLPYPVIIRTIDLGADKLSDAVKLPPEQNPMMGLRSIRLCFKIPEIFKTQIRALLRASEAGNLKIMIPMITNVSEIKKVKTIISEAKRELEKEGVPFNGRVEVGAMIEVPAAAVAADLIAEEADFLSIGTNDLIQYTFAADRMNENVDYVYEQGNPALMRLIKFVIDSAHKKQKSVALCGEMASDPAFTKILMGMGLDTFSMSAIAIPKIKKIIRTTSAREAQDFADKFIAGSFSQ